MRAWSGRLLLRAWVGVSTPRCHIALDPKHAKAKFCSSKPVELNNIVKKVKSFGKISIDLPYDVEIKPADPHEYPDMDTVLVKLFSKGEVDCRQKNDLIRVDVTNDTCEVHTRESDEIVNDVKCLIQTPVRYDIDVRTVGDASVEVHDMISDYITVQTEFGSIVGSKLQGKKITLSSSEGGSVTVQKGIQGSIEINTAKEGFVDADKCLGTQLDISTENGFVILGSNYCEKATFTTLNGNLNLNNLHMDSSVDINGSGMLNISCLDGSLQANLAEGSAKIQLARITGQSNIKSNSDVNLTVPDGLNAKLILKAEKLKVDKKIFGCYSEDKKKFAGKREGPKFVVESMKKVEVKQASWMESFQLNNTPK